MTGTMTGITIRSTCFAMLALALSLPTAHAADLDFAASKITVHVEKSGMFAAFAHNHVIAAPLASGQIDVQKRTIELTFRAADMKVLDPDSGASDRSTVESNMKGNEVLDAVRFPEIKFVSASVEVLAGQGAGVTRYQVDGNLTLHGVTRPIGMSVVFSGGHYTGKAVLKQTDFGITPIKIGGGAIRVKDPIEIDFEIAVK
jgi:polyisoprenoid-binding protein YceI